MRLILAVRSTLSGIIYRFEVRRPTLNVAASSSGGNKDRRNPGERLLYLQSYPRVRCLDCVFICPKVAIAATSLCWPRDQLLRASNLQCELKTIAQALLPRVGLWAILSHSDVQTAISGLTRQQHLSQARNPPFVCICSVGKPD